MSASLKGTVTVVIRDDAPMHYTGDSPGYRTVVLHLTPEQLRKINLGPMEAVSRAIIEPNHVVGKCRNCGGVIRETQTRFTDQDGTMGHVLPCPSPVEVPQ